MNRPTTLTRARRAVARLDLLATALIVVVIVSATLPAVARGRAHAFGAASNANLWTLGLGHAVYAADWNGRQFTAVNDDISTYGNGVFAFNSFEQITGAQHPGTILGWTVNAEFPSNPPYLFEYRCDGNLANASLTLPVNFVFAGATAYLGSFRIANARAFRQYVSSRFYAPVFYAPNDVIVHDAVATLMDEPWEYVDLPSTPGFGDVPRWSSYCLSPAAMHHPSVMRHPDDGGWQNPWTNPQGFTSPSFFAARFPNLKTFMLEHNWIQNAPPLPCNPAVRVSVYPACEPYQFNHALASAPRTLFYDLSVRELPNTEVKAADDGAIARTGSGLWSRDTVWGSDGYRNGVAYEEVGLSHHILTTDGILGRDTTAR